MAVSQGAIDLIQFDETNSKNSSAKICSKKLTFEQLHVETFKRASFIFFLLQVKNYNCSSGIFCLSKFHWRSWKYCRSILLFFFSVFLLFHVRFGSFISYFDTIRIEFSRRFQISVELFDIVAIHYRIFSTLIIMTTVNLPGI